MTMPAERSQPPRITYRLESEIDTGSIAKRLSGYKWKADCVRDLVRVLRPGAPYLDLNEVDAEDNAVRNALLVHYKRSNEGYATGMRRILRNLSGMDEYAGICGGGDQNLYLLSLLMKNNDLRRITLFDNNVSQLVNFKNIVKIFNTREGDDYVFAMDTKSLGSRSSTRGNDWRCRKPKIKSDLEINGMLCDFAGRVCRINERGRYFLYFSNTMFDSAHISPARSARVLRSVLANEMIKDGSVLMLMTIDLTEGSLLRKESEEGFRVLLCTEPKKKLSQGSFVDVREFCKAVKR